MVEAIGEYFGVADNAASSDEMMDLDEVVVIKPRNNFSSNALTYVVPRNVNYSRKKKESLTKSLINIRSNGTSKLFLPKLCADGKMHSQSIVIKQKILFSSPHGRDLSKAC